MTLTAQISRDTETQQMLLHPFYQAWMKGELSLGDLQNYAVQYTPFVDAFPRFVSRIHSQCTDSADRRQLLMNLLEEEGYPKGKDHPTLWRQFAQSLETNFNLLEKRPYTEASQALLSTFWSLCDSSYAEGLSALYAYEKQIPEVSKTKIRGLSEFYGIASDSAVEFFKVHEEADQFHSETCGDCLNKLSPEEQTRALAAAKIATDALWNFLSSCNGAKLAENS